MGDKTSPATTVFCHYCGGTTLHARARHTHSQNTQHAIVLSNTVLRLVEEALDCVDNERFTQNVGTTAVMTYGGVQ